MSGLNWRNVLANGLLVAFSVLLMFSGFELALYAGVVEAEADYPSYEPCHGKTTWQFHPEYGWTLRPNAVYLRQQNPNQERNLYRINSAGFRDTSDTGDRNVVMLGDSQTAGWIVNDNQTFAYLLDRETPETSFHNFGVPGYGTEQELAVYRNVSRVVEHDVVVLGYYLGNDMVDNVDQNPRRPEFVVRDGKLIQVRDPVNQSDTRANDSGGSAVGVIKRFLLDNTRTLSYLKPRVAALLSRTGLRSRQPPTGAELDHQLRLTRALLEELGEQADARDAELLIVAIPERTDIRPETPAHYPAKRGQAYWDAQRAMLSELADRNRNVHVLDPHSRYVREVNAGNRIYGRYNAHLDEYGHRVTAEMIHRRLVDMGYVGDRSDLSFNSKSAGEDQTCP